MSEEQTEEQTHGVSECGGPLICVNCAMSYAQAYHDQGKFLWSQMYQVHATKLHNEQEIVRLQQANQQLTLELSRLDRDMWKSYTYGS